MPSIAVIGTPQTAAPIGFSGTKPCPCPRQASRHWPLSAAACQLQLWLAGLGLSPDLGCVVGCPCAVEEQTPPPGLVLLISLTDLSMVVVSMVDAEVRNVKQQQQQQQQQQLGPLVQTSAKSHGCIQQASLRAGVPIGIGGGATWC